MTRKDSLEDLLDEAASPRIRWVDHFETGGGALIRSACHLGVEGVVSKRKDAPYRAGRDDSWVKTKCRPGQEVVIGGWVQAPQAPLKSLLVGVYDKGELRYAGSVKTGFGKPGDLLGRLKALETARTPFAAGEPPRKTREIHWTRPELVANVEIAEWTPISMV
jgi:bifunctional non-homologous end joining protein LigD